MIKMIHFNLCNEGSILLVLKCSLKKIRIASYNLPVRECQAYPMALERKKNSWAEMGGGRETNLAYTPVFLSKLK